MGSSVDSKTLPNGPASDVRILEVDSTILRNRWRSQFGGVYQTVFQRKPYFERYSPPEAAGVWDRLTGTPDNITLVAVTPMDRMVGFGLGIPLRNQRDVAQELTGLVGIQETFYFAELGVLPEYRGRGIGHALVRGRLERLAGSAFSNVVLRASATRDGHFQLYDEMGFSEMGVSQDVMAPRMDGRVATDRRVFLHCVLSQARTEVGSPPP